MSARFEGKVAVVTGAAGGIGRATCLRLAADGAGVVAVDVAADAAQETVAIVQAAGGKARAHVADVSDEAQVEACVQATVDALGGIDILYNNAGVEGPMSRIQHLPPGDFDRVIAVNQRGVFLGMKHAAPAMRARGGGAIINTSSIAGINGAPGMVAYAASKHAVIGMTKTAAAELARYKIRVNAVCPGYIETRMSDDLDRMINPDDPSLPRNAVIQRIPWQRYGQPAEVASVVAFLASNDASYMSGAVLTVDAAYSSTL